MSRRKMFERTYRENLFQGTESISGPGSNLDQTVIVRKELVKLCQDLNVKTLIDAPCGDCHWMELVWPKLSGIVQVYIGCDIVEEMTQINKERYESEVTVPKLWFETFDIVNEPLPTADLFFCRDCLVHLSFESVKQFLNNFAESNCKYLLATTFNRDGNMNFADGTGWYPMDLTKSPFNLPRPRLLINEGCTEGDGGYKDKSLGLWTREEIREACGN